jgi:glutamate synthase (NADPH/NADH) small chain
MEVKSPLIEILMDHKTKILEIGKYNQIEFEKLINSLNEAERERSLILEKIKKDGLIDIKKIQTELDLSEENVLNNIEYLKELGLLAFIDKHPRFFKEIIENSEKKGIFPSTKLIKEKNLCCGCGLCVAICPVNAIDYLEGSFVIDEDICINCGLCFSACPRSFFPKELEKLEENHDPNIKFVKQFNYYRDLFTAQTTEPRIKSVAQDGGIVTTLLKTAFKQGYINGSFAVTIGDQPLKPLPILIESEEDLLKTAGTKYTNVPVLKIFHDAKDHEKVAVVGTPCIMKALRKISFFPFNKPFYDNIVLKIGLFCMESFDYDKIVELLKNEFQVYPSDIKKMNIDKGKFIIYDQESNISNIPIKKIKKYGRFGCFFCDDLTAEYADISVGSIGSEPGWSTVIIRTKKGAEFFQKALDMNLITKKEIKEESKSFEDLSRIASSKLKKYVEQRRVKMLQQPPNERINNFEEVPYGLTDEMMKSEAQRCLQCGLPLCVTGCPVNIRIPEFIKLLREEKYVPALYKIKSSNLLPAICGRVCPQETQCENSCLLGSLGEPIAIGYLERYIADWERRNKLKECPECAPPMGIKVAVIGSGPAGLACAGELAMRGYDVTIFEAFHAGGGVLTYGIPEFRLPKEIVKDEIETLKMLDVKVNYNAIIGKTLSYEDLKEMGFKAFFIGVGAGLPMFLNISGLNLNGVLSANEFLTRSNLMKAYRFPEYDTPIKIGKIITVIGGGNVALDSARTALRLGAERVIIVYRRSEEEMPARREEYHHAIEEGVEFQFLTNPVRFIGDEAGNVKQMEVVKMKLGEPDESGRRRPITIENSEYLIDTDTVIVAVGTKANPVLTKSIPDLKLNKWGYIETNEEGQTNVEEIFAGGDIVTGSATVISAMGAGKKAAKAIDEFLRKKYINNKKE